MGIRQEWRQRRNCVLIAINSEPSARHCLLRGLCLRFEDADGVTYFFGGGLAVLGGDPAEADRHKSYEHCKPSNHERQSQNLTGVAASRQSAAFLVWEERVGGALPRRRYENLEGAFAFHIPVVVSWSFKMAGIKSSTVLATPQSADDWLLRRR